MTANQPIIAGAALAALLASVPIVWRAGQIIHVRQTMHTVSQDRTAAHGGESKSGASTAPFVPPPGKTKASRIRSTPPMSAAEKIEKLEAVIDLTELGIKATMLEWCERDAWAEARRTANALGLSPEMENELRTFLIAQYTSVLEAADVGNHDDKATSRRACAAELEEWFAARLTPKQEDARQLLNAAAQAATAEKLAEQALYYISSKLLLSDQQKSQLFAAAVAKATRSLEENTHARTAFASVTITPEGKATPVEERTEDFVMGVLDESQREIWRSTLMRDRAFSEAMPKRIIKEVVRLMRQVDLTVEDLIEECSE